MKSARRVALSSSFFFAIPSRCSAIYADGKSEEREAQRERGYM